MTKKMLASILVLCICGASFAQTTPKKILAAGDVDAFIANHAAIETDLEAFGDKYDKYFDIPDATPESSPADSVPDMAAAINALRATKVPDEVQAIMRKHGMGDNGFEKYIVISYGFGALYLEKMLKMQSASQAQTPEMKPYMDQAQRSVEQMKATLHGSDLALLSARLDDLAGVFNEQEE